MRRPALHLLACLLSVPVLSSGCSSAGAGDDAPAPAAGAAGPAAAAARRARLDAVMRSTSCAACHPAIYAEHMSNTHGLAFVDPEPRLATRDFQRENCIRCHTPRPVFETGIGMVPIERHYDLEEGNTCMTCHWKAGYDYAEFRGGRECATAFDGRAGTVEACATCHRIAGTPEQWMRAPAGKLAGRDCRSCHMPLVERPVAVGEPPRMVRSHAFPASRSESQLRRAYSYEARVEGNEAVVRITNDGAGHNFNTATIQRAVESVVIVRDPSGRAVTTDRRVYKNAYWNLAGLGLPGPSIPSGQTREHRVPLGMAAGTLECELLFKLYYPAEDGHPGLSRRLEHRVIPFQGVDPAAPPPPRPAAPPPPPFPAVSPEEAARPDGLVKFAHPASGVGEASVPAGDSPQDIAGLVALLEFPVPGARRQAHDRLLALGERAAPALAAALGHWSDETFNQAMDLLVELGAAAEPEVRRALGSDSLYVRYHARKVLARMGFPAGRGEIRDSQVAALGAARPVDRRSAAEALGRLGDPSVAPAIRPLLDDMDWDVVMEAAAALARLGDRGSIPDIERAMRLATFPETRWDLASALADLGSPAGIPVLLDGLDHPDDVLRARAFDAFFRATGLHMAYDPGAPRMERLEAIARLRSEWERHGGPAALLHPKAPDGAVHEKAWAMVQTLGGGTDVLAGGDDAVLLEALVAMGADAVPALVDGLTFPAGYSRKRALVCRALGRIGDPRAVPHLVRALRDPDLSVADWACWGLGRIGDGAAVPALRKFQRRVVSYALSHPGSPEAEADLRATPVLEVLASLGDGWAREEIAGLPPSPAGAPPAAGGLVPTTEARPVPVPTSPEDAIEKARALRAGDFYEDAIRVIRAAEARFGESPALTLETAWNLLMIAEEDMTRDIDPASIESGIADARRWFDDAVAKDPRVAGRELLEAKLLRHENRPAEARAVLEAHLKGTPGDALSHQELGDLAAGESDWATADREYTAVAALLPDDGLAVLYATEARQWLRRPAEELEAGYLRAARLLPGYEAPVRLLARLHPGDRAKTLDLLGRVVRENPKSSWGRIWIATVLEAGPEPGLARAETILEEAVATAPRDPATHFHLGKLLEAAGRPAEAARSYLRSLEAGAPGGAGDAADALDRLLRTDPAVQGLPPGDLARAWDVLVERTPGTGRYAFDGARWYRDVAHDPERSKHFLDAAFRAEPDNGSYDLEEAAPRRDP